MSLTKMSPFLNPQTSAFFIDANPYYSSFE